MVEELVTLYENTKQNASLAPGLDERLEKIYVSPNIVPRSKDTNVVGKEINSFKQLFTEDVKNNQGKEVKNIFILGEPGTGKTTFSTKIAFDWAGSKESQISKNNSSAVCDISEKERRQEKTKHFDDIETINQFDFLFYISLREVDPNNCYIDNIVFQEICTTLTLDKKYTEHFIAEILSQEHCLVVIDGVDEWANPNLVLPMRKAANNCTVLAFSRPWKLAHLPLKRSEVDKIFDLKGVIDRKLLTERILSCINETWQTQRSIESFEKKAKNMKHLLEIPILAISLLRLWFEENNLPETQAEIYRHMVDMLGRQNESKQKPQLIDSTDFQWSKLHSKSLDSLGRLAFNTLYQGEESSSIVFSGAVMEKYLTQDSIDVAVASGLLTKHRKISLLRQTYSVSFLHKTFQEYFAALHFCQRDTYELISTVRQYCENRKSVFDTEQLFLFVCGIDSSKAKQFSQTICSFIGTDMQVNACGKKDFIEQTQTMIQKGYMECKRSGNTRVDMTMTHVLLSCNISLRELPWIDTTIIESLRCKGDGNVSDALEIVLQSRTSLKHLIFDSNCDLRNFASQKTFSDSLQMLVLDGVKLPKSSLVSIVANLPRYLRFLCLSGLDLSNCEVVLPTSLECCQLKAVSISPKTWSNLLLNLPKCMRHLHLFQVTLGDQDICFAVPQTAENIHLSDIRFPVVRPGCCPVNDVYLRVGMNQKSWSALLINLPPLMRRLEICGVKLGQFDADIVLPATVKEITLEDVDLTAQTWAKIFSSLPYHLERIYVTHANLGNDENGIRLPRSIRSVLLLSNSSDRHKLGPLNQKEFDVDVAVKMSKKSWLNTLLKLPPGMEVLVVRNIDVGEISSTIILPSSLKHIYLHSLQLTQSTWMKMLSNLPPKTEVLCILHADLRDTDVNVVLPKLLKNLHLEGVLLTPWTWSRMLSKLPLTLERVYIDRADCGTENVQLILPSQAEELLLCDLSPDELKFTALKNGVFMNLKMLSKSWVYTLSALPPKVKALTLSRIDLSDIDVDIKLPRKLTLMRVYDVILTSTTWSKILSNLPPTLWCVDINYADVGNQDIDFVLPAAANLVYLYGLEEIHRHLFTQGIVLKAKMSSSTWAKILSSFHQGVKEIGVFGVALSDVELEIRMFESVQSLTLHNVTFAALTWAKLLSNLPSSLKEFYIDNVNLSNAEFVIKWPEGVKSICLCPVDWESGSSSCEATLKLKAPKRDWANILCNLPSHATVIQVFDINLNDININMLMHDGAKEMSLKNVALSSKSWKKLLSNMPKSLERIDIDNVDLGDEDLELLLPECAKEIYLGTLDCSFHNKTAKVDVRFKLNTSEHTWAYTLCHLPQEVEDLQLHGVFLGDVCKTFFFPAGLKMVLLQSVSMKPSMWKQLFSCLPAQLSTLEIRDVNMGNDDIYLVLPVSAKRVVLQRSAKAGGLEEKPESAQGSFVLTCVDVLEPRGFWINILSSLPPHIDTLKLFHIDLTDVSQKTDQSAIYSLQTLICKNCNLAGWDFSSLFVDKARCLWLRDDTMASVPLRHLLEMAKHTVFTERFSIKRCCCTSPQDYVVISTDEELPTWFDIQFDHTGINVEKKRYVVFK